VATLDLGPKASQVSAKIGWMEPLKVITEPRRREMLRLVWDDARTAGEIAEHFEISFGAVSQHLAVLRRAGFVSVQRQGNRRIYRADKEGLGDLVPVLRAMWASSLDALVQTIEHDHRPDSDRLTHPTREDPS
jgi:DNA-binding transcriptional ArsR family regulator